MKSITDKISFSVCLLKDEYQKKIQNILAHSPLLNRHCFTEKSLILPQDLFKPLYLPSTFKRPKKLRDTQVKYKVMALCFKLHVYLFYKKRELLKSEDRKGLIKK